MLDERAYGAGIVTEPSRGATRRLRSWFANALLVAMSSIAMLVALELALRGSAWWHERRAIAALATAERPAIPPGKTVEMRDMLIPSRHPDVLFRLPNNLAVHFCRTALTTNSRGFRSVEVATEKPPGTTRIVGIGDSVMFGWGVDDGEEYMAQLASMLRRRTPGHRWEVVNTAVPGYNTWMEVATLEHRALDLAPDIVVYGYCINDGELPRFLRRTEDYLSLQTSYLLRFLASRRLAGAGPSPEELEHLVDSPVTRRSLATDPAKVPSEYAHMVGDAGHGRALDRLRELSVEHGFKVIVLVHPPGPPDGDRQFEKRGFDVVHSKPLLDRHVAGRPSDPGAERELYVGRPCSGKGFDMHPSPLAHGLIARSIFEHLERRGLLAGAAEVRERSGVDPAGTATPRARS